MDRKVLLARRVEFLRHVARSLEDEPDQDELRELFDVANTDSFMTVLEEVWQRMGDVDLTVQAFYNTIQPRGNETLTDVRERYIEGSDMSMRTLLRYEVRGANRVARAWDKAREAVTDRAAERPADGSLEQRIAKLEENVAKIMEALKLT